ncbi:MAG: glycosyltransferase family 4 protein [Bacteroidia bacterium]
MQIFIITYTNPYFSNSASSNRLISLTEGLINEGVDIQYLITNGYQSSHEKFELGLTGKFKGLKYLYLSTTLLDNIWKRRWHIYVWNKVSSIYIKYKIYKTLKNTSGIVWAENNTEILQSVLKVKLKNKELKIFMELSEFPDIHHFNKGNRFQRKIANKRQLFFETIFFKNLDGLALMTKTLINHYSNFPVPKPQLLHLPMTVDLERFNQTITILENFESPYIAFVGVMDNAKDGVNILIQAFAKIATKYQNLKLYLIGSWNYDTPAHLELIKNLNLQDRVKWLGEFSRDKIPAIVKNASLLVLPRPDSKQAQGGFPTKLGEYLASGVPVCATTVGEIPNYLTNNESVFFAEPGSVDSFANAMDRALSNPELAQKVGFAGRNIAEVHFNKDIQAKKLFDFLQTL